MKEHKLSRSSKSNLKGVRKEIILLLNRVIKRSEHDFGIPKNGGKRSPQVQNNLFHQRPKVTWLDGFKKISYHQSGNAFDIFIYDEHGACWKCEEKYKITAELIRDEFNLMWAEGIFKENEILIWGGDWKRWRDLPHFEIR